MNDLPQATRDRTHTLLAHLLRAISPELRVDGETPLMMAVAVDDLELVRELLKRGANVHARRTSDPQAPSPDFRAGRVAAHLAVSEPVLSLLLEAGADPSAVDDAGVSVLETVASRHLDGGVTALLAAGASVEGSCAPEHGGPLWGCMATQSHEAPTTAMALLLAAGANPNRKGPDGQTALHRAAAKGLPSVLTLLAAYGADPTLPDDTGRLARELLAQRPEKADTATIRAAARSAMDRLENAWRLGHCVPEAMAAATKPRL